MSTDDTAVLRSTIESVVEQNTAVTRRIHLLVFAALPLAAQSADPDNRPVPYIPPTVVVQGPLPTDANPNPSFGLGPGGQPQTFNPADLIAPPNPLTTPRPGATVPTPAYPAPPPPPPVSRPVEVAPLGAEATFSRLQETIASLELQVNTLRQMLSRSSGAGAPTQLAITAFRRGRDLAEQRLYRAAIDAFSEAILLDPANDSAFLLRGEAYQHLGDFTSAEADFTRSLELQPDNSRAYLSRATVRSALGRIPFAFADANEALRRDPQNPQARLARARLNELAGDYNAAIADYTGALTSGKLFGPGSEPAYIGRATAYLRSGRIEEASFDCQAAVRSNPNAPLAHLCLAEVHLRTNSVELAMASMNAAMMAAQTTGQPLPVIPQLPSVVLARNTAPIAPVPVPAAVIAEVKKPEPAVVAAATPKPVAPKPPAPKPSVAKEVAAKEVKVEAKAEPKPPTPTQLAKEIVTQKNMSLRAPSALDYEKQARELTNLHNYEDALVLINKALEQAPKSAKALNSRGFIFLLKGSYKEAIADFTEAIRLKPDYANAFHNRAVALRKLSENSAADEDEKNASRLIASANPIQ